MRAKTIRYLYPYNWTHARSVIGTHTAVRNDQRHPTNLRVFILSSFSTLQPLDLMSATAFIGRQLRKHQCRSTSTARAVAVRGSFNL